MTYLNEYKTENKHGSGVVLSWASIIDEQTVEQACKVGRLPVVEGHVAIMPDAHFGFGPPVGTAVKTKGAVIPAAVGVDIGCGMIAVRTSAHRDDLRGVEGKIMAGIRTGIPSGVGTSHEKPLESADVFVKTYGHAPGTMGGLDLRDGFAEKTLMQFGTLGAGNHFAEVSEDAESRVWLVVHSGSRGPGNVLATLHAKRARTFCAAMGIAMEDDEFAYFPDGSPEAAAYLADMLWAQSYAFHQREAMMDAMLAAVRDVVSVDEIERINCHHNYAEQNDEGWLTRKGAIDASVGVMGIIPGSMGASTYIVRGLGNEQALNTSPHGAGRMMSRNQARKTLDGAEFRRQMAGKTWLDRDADKLLDEAPNAYKPIEQVMADARTLVEPLAVLSQFVNYKGL